MGEKPTSPEVAADLAQRAALLRKRGTPELWSEFVAEVWLQLESIDASADALTNDQLQTIAAKLDKEPAAVARAVAMLRRAAAGEQSPPPPAS